MAPSPLSFTPSAQETQLSFEENQKLMHYRINESKNTITPDEETDFKHLRTKLDIHIKALEREIPKAKEFYDAQAKLNDLWRSYFLIGTQIQSVRSNTHDPCGIRPCSRSQATTCSGISK